MPIADADPPETDEPRRVVPDATCTACGCLCDDIRVEISGGRIAEAGGACEIGRAWFLRHHSPEGRPPSTIDGRPVPVDEALDRAAEILRSARSAIVLGLDSIPIEAQAEAVAVADRIGSAVDPTHAASALPGLLGFQASGRVSASLGEVKDRSDVVVFWLVDPARTHPRHFERYSVEPAGRFVPGGRADRTILAAGRPGTATGAIADAFLEVDPLREFEILWTLRAIARGIDLDPGAVRRSTGIDLDRLLAWAGPMRGARYGAFFFGEDEGPDREGLGSGRSEAIAGLVRDLNGSGRFVGLAMGGPGNPGGVEAVLAWQAGAALAVDLAGPTPAFRPGEASAAGRLGRGEADAALIVGDDPRPGLSGPARDHLATIPTVVVAHDATDPARSASVGIASATPGIHEGGTIVRVDGLSLSLRPALESPLPASRAILSAILGRLGGGAVP